MVDVEPAVLNHYNIVTPYPTGWPTEKDESDTSEDENLSNGVAKVGVRRSRSRYSALERNGIDRRSHVPGSEKTGDGVENLVQKDEADPLGGPNSVVRVLRQKGLAVEDDQRLREQFRSCQISQILIVPRKSLSSVLNHFLAILVSLPGSF